MKEHAQELLHLNNFIKQIIDSSEDMFVLFDRETKIVYCSDSVIRLAALKEPSEIIGKRLLEKNIKSVVFDRNGYLYHGIVKALADGTRKAGIEF